jgi:hypothetical protein
MLGASGELVASATFTRRGAPPSIARSPEDPPRRSSPAAREGAFASVPASRESTMNHIPYEIALMRRDDLLRAAAERRLASHAATSVEGEPTLTLTRRLRKLRRLLQLSFAGLTGTSQTYAERKLDGRL